MLKTKYLNYVIAVVIVLNFGALFFPGFVNSNSRMYATIAKNIALTGDWVDLIYNGKDWLDKPHFPFWVTALSFKIFGINTFAYVLPGFIFNLVGAFFTYKLALKLYNQNIALLSCLIYLSVLRLLIGTTSVRAEAYLVGEIIPACYYWLLYDKETKFKYLFLGSIFTALVVMTKGLSLIIPVISGLLAVSFFKKEWKRFFALKWLMAIFLIFIFISPELIALYLQYDLHPEKILFGRDHISGIKFFFWDSQLGRIFNFGPISEHRGYLLFYVHTFFWAFLPWCLVFVIAIYEGIKNFKSSSDRDKTNLVYLYSSFFMPLMLFSVTKFQRDYYTDIIFPFAAIISAHFFLQMFENRKYVKSLFYLQMVLSTLFVFIALLAFVFIGLGNVYNLLLIAPILLIVYMIYKRKDFHDINAITYPCLAIAVAFLCCQAAIWKSYKNFDPGYKLNSYLIQQKKHSVYFYKIDDTTGLYFYSQFPCFWLNEINEINEKQEDYYLVTQEEFVDGVMKLLPQAKIMSQFDGFQTASFFPLLRQNFKTDFNTKLIILKVEVVNPKTTSRF